MLAYVFLVIVISQVADELYSAVTRRETFSLVHRKWMSRLDLN